MLEWIEPRDEAVVLERWRERIAVARRQLGWPDGPVVARPHAAGISLALAAPFDQLFTATEVNEWALCASLVERAPERRDELERALVVPEAGTDDLPVLDDEAALARLARLAASEERPDLAELLRAASAHAVPALLDEEGVTLGTGCRGRSWPLDAVPSPAAVDWAALGTVPIAVVTGSNGKTTTVRLLAACASAHGWRTGYSSTDGLVIDGETIAPGDYSGPVGARTVLRDPRVEAAVLETARGGILRRGLAIARAHAAVVTNISSDHFGEYGIDDLAALAEAKLVVARTVASGGLLVLNADDATLRTRAAETEADIGWFALDADDPLLVAHRAAGGPTCGIRNDHLWLEWGGEHHDLGPIDAMPLTASGCAAYNIANVAAAALAAAALGIDAASIRATFARFGARLEDNPGRLMHFEIGGLRLVVDYAHNPAGLSGVLAVARRLQGAGRLLMLLGHAGNRTDQDLERVAAVAAEARPDLIVVKEIDGYQRGRAEGEIARILRTRLLAHGMAEERLPVRLHEFDAVRCALDSARTGDIVLLLVHSPAARAETSALLTRLREQGWHAGDPLPK
ncbi:MAG TPA: Mur ligase family protein [Steroidobacteraceae bacterium]|nr:Mur ligase family protein [Steroidobacteraceae bacterium]